MDPYKILGIKNDASKAEIKFAYRKLVKKHHPDAGGDETKILLLNAAWEILSDQEKRSKYDLINSKKYNDNYNTQEELVNKVQAESNIEETQIRFWLKTIYTPIDKLIGEIINRFPSQIKDLSADPYDESIMDSFCEYIELSQSKIKKINLTYQKLMAPNSCKNLSLSLYHCFSQVEDAINELRIYTLGYVDNYLHDGIEMMRLAKKNRSEMKKKRRNLPLA